MCRKKLEALKDDPELAAVFEDIKNCGAAAMERYWNDTELMTKISQKMGALGVGTQQQPSKAAKHIPVRSGCYGSSPYGMSLHVMVSTIAAVNMRLMSVQCQKCC